MSTDQENFLSADEKTVNLWSLDLANRAAVFNIVNLNQNQGKNISLISSASFSQFTQSQIFLYSMSNGDINICDFREKSDFNKKPSILLSTSRENGSSSYSNWLNYVSSALFLPDPHLILSREYLKIKTWDLRMHRAIISADIDDTLTKNIA